MWFTNFWIPRFLLRRTKTVVFFSPFYHSSWITTTKKASLTFINLILQAHFYTDWYTVSQIQYNYRKKEISSRNPSKIIDHARDCVKESAWNASILLIAFAGIYVPFRWCWSLLGHCLPWLRQRSLAKRFTMKRAAGRRGWDKGGTIDRESMPGAKLRSTSTPYRQGPPIADFLMNGRRLIRISNGVCIVRCSA